MNEKLDYNLNTSPELTNEDKRVTELLKIYEKVDRLLYHLTQRISNEKPSYKVDNLI